MSGNPSSKTSQVINEQIWVINFRRNLNEEIEELDSIPANIYTVPRPMMVTDPDSYLPQQVAIGPWHYNRGQVYEMEKYKMASAKRVMKQLQNENFHNLIDQYKENEARIRSCYHKFLNISGETLSLLMAMDAAFLMECLQVCAVKDRKVLTKIPSLLSTLVELAVRKWGPGAILRDLVMLENQIPLFVLRMMMDQQFSSAEAADEMLYSMLVCFTREIFPPKMVKDIPKCHVKDRAHLLDFVYHTLVPSACLESVLAEVKRQQTETVEVCGKDKCEEEDELTIGKFIVRFITGPVQVVKKIIFSKPVKTLATLPFLICSNVPVFRVMKEPLENLFSHIDEIPEDDEGGPASGLRSDKPPLIEELAIPSVTDLRKSGMRFRATKEGLTSIAFDEKHGVLHLPVISLDMNSNVVLRNLAAYEAGKGTWPLVVNRYIEFMNGIIDTEDDVKLLREKGIIISRLKSDEEVANLWNRMSRCVKLRNVPFLDKVINDVNKWHEARWSVKTKKFMKTYVFESWKILTFLATVLMLLLMSLQAFCSVYSCGHLDIHTTITGSDQP